MTIATSGWPNAAWWRQNVGCCGFPLPISVRDKLRRSFWINSWRSSKGWEANTVVDQPMAVNKSEWFAIEPPSTARRGVLDAIRFRQLNKLLSMPIGLSRDDIIQRFCVRHGISRQCVEAELLTFRHFSPDSVH
jgi:hypothetical protein